MDTEALFQKFRHASRLMRPRGYRGGTQQPDSGRGYGDRAGHASDPTRGRGRILAALKLQDAVPTKDLAFILGMRVASLNELLGKLERTELITREPSEEDKRIILIRLTEEGRRTEQFKPKHPDAFSPLSEDEQQQLEGFLDRIIEHLEVKLAETEAPDEDFERWSEQARARMGAERFDRWMSQISEYAPDGYAGIYSRRHGGRGYVGRGRGHGGGGRWHWDHDDHDDRRHHSDRHCGHSGHYERNRHHGRGFGPKFR